MPPSSRVANVFPLSFFSCPLNCNVYIAAGKHIFGSGEAAWWTRFHGRYMSSDNPSGVARPLLLSSSATRTGSAFVTARWTWQWGWAFVTSASQQRDGWLINVGETRRNLSEGSRHALIWEMIGIFRQLMPYFDHAVLSFAFVMMRLGNPLQQYSTGSWSSTRKCWKLEIRAFLIWRDSSMVMHRPNGIVPISKLYFIMWYFINKLLLPNPCILRTVFKAYALFLLEPFFPPLRYTSACSVHQYSRLQCVSNVIMKFI